MSYPPNRRAAKAGEWTALTLHTEQEKWGESSQHQSWLDQLDHDVSSNIRTDWQLSELLPSLQCHGTVLTCTFSPAMPQGQPSLFGRAMKLQGKRGTPGLGQQQGRTGMTGESEGRGTLERRFWGEYEAFNLCSHFLVSGPHAWSPQAFIFLSQTRWTTYTTVSTITESTTHCPHTGLTPGPHLLPLLLSSRELGKGGWGVAEYHSRALGLTMSLGGRTCLCRNGPVGPCSWAPVLWYNLPPSHLGCLLQHMPKQKQNEGEKKEKTPQISLSKD